jgi:hypothetical protein
MIAKTDKLRTSVISNFPYLNRKQQNRIFKSCGYVTKYCEELKNLEETDGSYGNRVKRVFQHLHRFDRYLSNQKLQTINQIVGEIRNLWDEFRQKYPPIPINMDLDMSKVSVTLSQQKAVNRQVFLIQDSNTIYLNYEDSISLATWLLENIREYLIHPDYL